MKIRFWNVVLLTWLLASCHSAPPSPAADSAVQDDPTLRHQIIADIQKFALEDAASQHLADYQAKFPASSELPQLKQALAERYIDQTWLLLANNLPAAKLHPNTVGESPAQTPVNAELRSKLSYLLTQAERWGADASHLASAKKALNRAFPAVAEAVKIETPVPPSAAAMKPSKKAKTKLEKTNVAALPKPVLAPNTLPSNQSNQNIGSEKSTVSSASQPTAAATKSAAESAPVVTSDKPVAAMPGRREIRLNQADVEARSELIADILKQISKHIAVEPVNVVIQSRSMKDFRWLNALLKTSLQSLAPQYNLVSEPIVDPTAAPAVILILR